MAEELREVRGPIRGEILSGTTKLGEFAGTIYITLPSALADAIPMDFQDEVPLELEMASQQGTVSGKFSINPASFFGRFDAVAQLTLPPPPPTPIEQRQRQELDALIRMLDATGHPKYFRLFNFPPALVGGVDATATGLWARAEVYSMNVTYYAFLPNARNDGPDQSHPLGSFSMHISRVTVDFNPGDVISVTFVGP